MPPPPVPLILAGWAYSNDVEKRSRWQETLAWADHHGLGTLLSDIGDELDACCERAMKVFRV